MTIRDLPDEVHEALKERARRNRRSLNQEVIVELSALVKGGDDRAEAWRLAEQMLAEYRVPGKCGVKAGEIDRARREGRR